MALTNSPYLSAEVAEERTNSYLVRSSWYLSQTEFSVSLHPLKYYSVGLTQPPVIDALMNPNRKCYDLRPLYRVTTNIVV